VRPLAWRPGPGGEDRQDAAAEPDPAAQELKLAQQRLSQLQQSMEQRLRESFEAGRREGEQLAHKQAAAQIEGLQAQVARVITELAQARSRLFRQTEQDMLKLSLEIARRIVHRELRSDPEAVDALIRHALEKAQAQEIHRVRVHPAQEGWIRDALKRLGEARVEVVADASLEPGGLLFEAACGILDASVQTQFREIEEGLADRLGRQGRA